MREVMLGQADNLGGGVFKKRLGKNRYRSIVVAKGGRYWIFAYLFAKQAKANIRQDELQRFRDLADLYSRKSEADIAQELRIAVIVEICHEENPEIQERSFRGHS